MGDDAPGWAAAAGDKGPTCYKCLGSGRRPVPKRKRVVLQEDAASEPVEIPCHICSGNGHLPPKKVKPPRLEGGKPRPVPSGWVTPGPEPVGGVALESDEELSSLVGRWRIFQKGQGGHRWSTDDLITAWVACRALTRSPVVANAPPLRFADLGCGIGSVLLMTAWRFPTATSVGVEAQELSAGMAERSIRYNGVDARVKVRRGDLREFDGDGGEVFDLVTGTPPYFGVKWDTETGAALPEMGSLPTNRQSAPARFEFRGKVEDYLETAKRLVKEDVGRIAVCEGCLYQGDPLKRGVEAAAKLGLRLMETVLVHGKEGKPPLFAVHVLRRGRTREALDGDAEGGHVVEHLHIRDVSGKRSAEYNTLVAEMGIPPYVE